MVFAERRSAPSTRVRVKGGYDPPVVRGRVGEPLRIVFSREETASCSEHVVFPALGLSAMLPPYQDVTLELVPEHAGEYEFTCQLGALRGVLVVDGDARAAGRADRRRRTGRRRDVHYCAMLLLAVVLALIVLVVLLA
jgi:plastocyanin domain-containing protein